MMRCACPTALCLLLLAAHAATLATAADRQGGALSVDPVALRLAIDDLAASFGARYPGAASFRGRLEAILQRPRDAAAAHDLEVLAREALLANPMLDGDRVLVIERHLGATARSAGTKGQRGTELGLVLQNSCTNDTIPHGGWDNRIALLSDLRGQARLSTFFKSEGGRIISDVDVDFSATKVMFSSIGSHDRWHLFEVDASGGGLRQLTPADLPDVDHFDSCYLPSGRIAFCSTAGYQGLPCQNGAKTMAQLFTMAGDGTDIRRIAFEQDSDWCPTVLNNGRLLYLRWEYADTMHYFTRLLFHCNPDGTGQMEYYGSNSYFPKSFYYARPIPGHPTAVVGVLTGHHGVARAGRLLILDPALGRHDAEGVVQEIPGRGRKVEAVIKDQLIDGVWPEFLHPYPLADYADPEHPLFGGRYFLVAMKPRSDALWGIYLVDIFDNLTLIKEVEGGALFEPIPFHPMPRPPVIPERVTPGAQEATVVLTDIASGPGLEGVPHGTVKSLRLFSYHFAYNGTGGHDSVGIQSGWDIKRILGTVPVEEDGSASFRIPANTPIAVQPLDGRGRALQLMRSWFVGMPGEVVSCVGCHDRQSSAPPVRSTISSRRAPSAITPWYGPARPFAFRTEIQPVLDRFCVSCHNCRPGGGSTMPDFRPVPEAASYAQDTAYLGLHPWVRRPGPESDYRLMRPLEYHVSTSALFQMLGKGHHGVTLDSEAWDRLTTWVDLNAPWRGKWGASRWRNQDQASRRRELAHLYADLDADPEREYAETAARVQHRPPAPVAPVSPPSPRTGVPACANWPFPAEEARRRQQAAGPAVTRRVELGGGVGLDLVLIPAGSFVMGEAEGDSDEWPLAVVEVARPFWLGRCEITNRQYRAFDATHDSRTIDRQWKDQVDPGYPANLPEQPVIRVTWRQAQAFCAWLSRLTGEQAALPSEAQWEWACRAGTASACWYGDALSDFSAVANLADRSLRGFALRGFPPVEVKTLVSREAFIPRCDEVDDGAMISAAVGGYRPNPWGLCDMHGNVAEWTASLYRPYPVRAGDGRDDPSASGERVVRGGSWRDKPRAARSGYRLAYQDYQPVYNVGFRVVLEAR